MGKAKERKASGLRVRPLKGEEVGVRFEGKADGLKARNLRVRLMRERPAV